MAEPEPEAEPEAEPEEPCVFCAIARGQSYGHIVYEDDEVIAFLDARPVARGHTLVVPRTHRQHVLQMDEQETAAVFRCVRRVASAVMRALEADGFNLGANTGVVAGQTVPHAHVHIIPRYKGDAFWCTRNPTSMPSNSDTVYPEELLHTCMLISRELRRRENDDAIENDASAVPRLELAIQMPLSNARGTEKKSARTQMQASGTFRTMAKM